MNNDTIPVPRRRRNLRSRGPVAHGTALLLALIWAFPAYWMVNSAFKTPDNLTSVVPQFFPSPISLDAFIRAFQKAGFLTSLGNSLFVAVCVVAASIAIGFLATAALTRFRFFGRKAILITILAIQMIPSIALLIPLFLTFRDANMLNTYWALMLAYLASALPFSIWVLRGFFQSIPAEIDEAARIDGAGDMRVLWSIYFPLVLPGLISTAVFTFIEAWNDYIMAYILLQEQARYTLPVWLVSFNQDTGIDYGGLIAASVMFSIPVVVFFLIVQRNLVAGMSGGAVKG
ncbi:MAG: carbohydrate ABC transporter permease [Microbacterium sp.]